MSSQSIFSWQIGRTLRDRDCWVLSLLVWICHEKQLCCLGNHTGKESTAFNMSTPKNGSRQNPAQHLDRCSDWGGALPFSLYSEEPRSIVIGSSKRYPYDEPWRTDLSSATLELLLS